MKKGSLVRIKQSGDPKLIGTYGLVERFVEFIEGDYVIIHRLVDGCKDSYHKTSLEGVSMKIGDLVKILSVFSKEDEKYIGTVGILRCRPMGLDNTWGVHVGNRMIYLADERLELI